MPHIISRIHNTSMSLLNLPNELLCQIAEGLQVECDIAAITRISKRIHNVTIAHLYRVNAKLSESSALLWAATHGSLATASKALKEISSGDDDKAVTAAIVLAAGANHGEIVRLLVEKGACLHAYDPKRRRNAMEAAAEKGHTDIVRLLLDLGAEPRVGLGNHPFAVQFAAMGGHIEIVRLLIEAGEDPDHCSGRPGGGSYSPLQAAALNDNVDLAKLLLAKGAKINHRSSSGDTPLELAVMKISLRCLKLLLESGAKVYGQDNGNICRPALKLAMQSGREQCLELLKNEIVHDYCEEEDAW